MASAIGDYETIELLLKYGALPNVKDNKGNTALHCAAHANHPSCVTLLVTQGANIDALNNVSTLG